MSQTCPRCGNPNDDGVRFCTSCGHPFGDVQGQPGPAVSGARPAGNMTVKLLVGAGIIIVIAGIILATAGSGLTGIFPPYGSPPATLPPVTTNTVSYTATPSPEPVTLPATETTIPATSPVTVTSSPAPVKPIACPSDRRICGVNCSDLMTDTENCGDCGVICFPGQECQAGHCRNACSFGENSCFDGCHNLSTDADNCGTCGNMCPFGLVCNRSVCSPPVTTVIPTYSG